MHIHILGICGTFMGGIARLAVEKGYRVTGSDKGCYPPMSDQLEALGISLHQGYDAEQLKASADCVIVGNSLSRGVEVIEALLDSNQLFRSGPQWLSENILQDKWVIACAGTHGKTSTASMVAWILEANGFNPGFLIGGVMENFGASARLTESPFFVVEADEYDTAFFDKRSKFIHYRARTCILNNLEFDHADIFANLAAIETQFHHLVRTIPGNGLIIRPAESKPLDSVLDKGCWTPVTHFSAAGRDKEGTGWRASKLADDGSCCDIYYADELVGQLNWSLIGDHNVNNALAAIAAAHHVGVQANDAISALASFKNVKRRMELKGSVNGIQVYDDFAHHPTAIKTTIQGLRAKVGSGRIVAVVDLASNTMKNGTHKATLPAAVKEADMTIFHVPESIQWDVNPEGDEHILCLDSSQAIVEKLTDIAKPEDAYLIMSNGGFGGIHQRLVDALGKRFNR